jgi:16S rRNA (adenine(1408)-N(1))-methyltransferase
VIDVGTGDGLFVYNSARRDSQALFIGIDANSRPLQKISEKIHRKPAKGGLPNVLFLQSAVETLPSELDGIAAEVHVNFPWGSLLRAVVAGDQAILQSLRRMCADEARLSVVIGLDVDRDRSEIDRLQLPAVDADYLRLVLLARYASAGFEVIKTDALAGAALSELQTSWASRLKAGSKRSFIRIVARAV